MSLANNLIPPVRLAVVNSTFTYPIVNGVFLCESEIIEFSYQVDSDSIQFSLNQTVKSVNLDYETG